MPRAMPGEATLVASWRALARTSAGATVSETPGSVSAVFPVWAPLNNAIGRVAALDVDATAAEVARLAQRYTVAGVDAWAYWVSSASRHLGDADDAIVAGAARDATTLVMTADLGDLADGVSTSAHAVPTTIATAAMAGDTRVAVDELGVADSGSEIEAWVMVRDGFAVAGLWACVHDADCGIYAVGTVPGWRRQGIAGALVEHALAAARGRGARTASLQSTPEAVSLYESLGFVAVGRYAEWLVTTAGR